MSDGDGPALLKAFSAYLLLLAVNGMTECFMFAVRSCVMQSTASAHVTTQAMSAAAVDTHNRWMVFFSVIFLVSAWGFTHALGSIGFIAANCVNMAVRIARRLTQPYRHAWHVRSLHSPALHSLHTTFPRGAMPSSRIGASCPVQWC